MKALFARTLALFICLAFCIMAQAQKSSLKALDIDLGNYQYPFPVSYIHLSIQGEEIKMAYMDVKPVNPNGHTVMLLHGKNFNGAYWRQTAQVLADSGYRVVIPDQVGFGKSSKPKKMQYSFQLLAQNTKSVLDTLGITKVCILGHSTGGMVATRFTLMYPAMVEKFILEDPIGLEDYKLKVPYQNVDKWYKRELAQTYDSLKNYEQTSYYHGTWKPEYDEWLNLQAGWTLNPDYKRIAWNSALIYDMIFTQPVVYEFENITAPTLIIVGKLDKSAIGKNFASDSVKQTMGNFTELGMATQDKIQGAKLIELDGVGHIPHVEVFDKFIQPVLKFLRG